jgi:hypothetical protein
MRGQRPITLPPTYTTFGIGNGPEDASSLTLSIQTGYYSSRLSIGLCPPAVGPRVAEGVKVGNHSIGV